MYEDDERRVAVPRGLRVPWPGPLPIAVLAATLVAVGACGGSDPDGTDGEVAAPVTTPVCTTPDVMRVFSENRCALCHSDDGAGGIDLMSEGLEERLVDRPSGNPTCGDRVIVDSQTPEASMLLRIVDPAGTDDPYCLPSDIHISASEDLSADELGCVREWVEGLKGFEIASQEIPVPGDPLTVSSKIKYVLHGGVVTLDELDRITAGDGTIDAAGLEAVVGEWMQTAEFRDKRRQFLELSLQQDPADTNYFYQFRNTRIAAARGVVDNFRTSMIRTAERIIDADEDWRTIVTTNEWEVTSLLMLAILMADNPVHTDRNRKNYALNDITVVLRGNDPVYTDADAQDWRTVRLVHDPSSTLMTTNEEIEDPANAEMLRSIEDGGTLPVRAPRVGFFTTPAFYQNWLTNEDNEFRVTVGQALLVGLGELFTAGDPTARNVGDDDIDVEAFPVGTECYGCHKNLDPMTAVFEQDYDATYSRFRVPESVRETDFSFRGHSEPIGTMQEFAQAVATHPAFGRAWVLRLCQWGSSIRCDPQDPVIEQLTRDFEDSGYKLNRLFQKLFSSPLFTRDSLAEQSQLPGAQVTIAREDHFCYAIEQRLETIAGGPTDRADICGRNAVQELLSGSLPSEEWPRGEVAFHQPTRFGAMSALALEGLCASSAGDLVGNDNRVFSRNDPALALDQMVSGILGLPEGTERFDEQRGVLQTIYDVQTAEPVCSGPSELQASLDADAPSCGMGLGAEDALRNAWTIVCQSPSLSGVGL